MNTDSTTSTVITIAAVAHPLKKFSIFTPAIAGRLMRNARISPAL
jgi:hypothetical protein